MKTSEQSRHYWILLSVDNNANEWWLWFKHSHIQRPQRTLHQAILRLLTATAALVSMSWYTVTTNQNEYSVATQSTTSNTTSDQDPRSTSSTNWLQIVFSVWLAQTIRPWRPVAPTRRRQVVWSLSTTDKSCRVSIDQLVLFVCTLLPLKSTHTHCTISRTTLSTHSASFSARH